MPQDIPIAPKSLISSETGADALDFWPASSCLRKCSVERLRQRLPHVAPLATQLSGEIKKGVKPEGSMYV